MKDPVARFRSLPDLRALTPARVALGRSGVSLPTQALLAFELDHARARDAVHADFDTSAVISDLGELGLSALRVESQAGDRKTYLRRPDLGRRLDQASQRLLADTGKAGQLAIVIGDGLSPTAVHTHA
ncbi:MAG TPA: ethanolamine ammonia-lyase light chain EutC, partial [Bradyrhizobium sp.]